MMKSLIYFISKTLKSKRRLIIFSLSFIFGIIFFGAVNNLKAEEFDFYKAYHLGIIEGFEVNIVGKFNFLEDKVVEIERDGERHQFSLAENFSKISQPSIGERARLRAFFCFVDNQFYITHLTN